MKRSTRTGLTLAAGVLFGWLAVVPGLAQEVSKEKAADFLDGLRQRGYFELALDYLDKIRQSPRCPDDLKATIDYEAAVTLVLGSAQIGTPEGQEKQFDEARKQFEKFVKEHPSHPLASTAQTQLANVLVKRGRLKMRLADQATKPDAEKKKLKEEARAFYQQAQRLFEDAERRVYERAKKLEGDLDPKKDADKIVERDAARADLLQARLYLAAMEHEIGKTYPADSKEFKDRLAKAASQYKELADKYGSFGGGLYARMEEGHVYKDLGQTDKAAEVLKVMLTLPGSSEAFRRLKNQSLVLLLETYLLPKEKKYDDALTRVDEWMEDARGAEESTEEGLAIHYLAGTAALNQAESLKADDPKRKDRLTAARRHFDFVARFPGENQRDARSKLLSLAGNTDAEKPEPTNYLEAKDQADFAWGTMVVALGQAQNQADKKAQAKAAAQMNEARDEAIKYYRMAIAMRTPEVSIDEINLIRFRLTYLYWLSENYYSSAVMGEFLATRYPQSAGARKGAEIAVKAYRTLFTEAKKHSQDASFETKKMEDMATYITTRWPKEPEAQEAWMMLIDTAVDNRDLAGALAYLEKIAPDSPQRAQAELRTGQALWLAYITGSSLEDDQRPPQEELEAMAQKARETLEAGVNRMRKEVEAGQRPSYALVYSVLSLAQIQIGAGQSAEAVKWLEDPKIGPLTLVNGKQQPVRGNDEFAEETYKAALRAYVGAQMLDQAEATMKSLEGLVAAGDDAESKRRLTLIYIQLGRELQDLLKRLRSENKTEELNRVSQGFELFLNKISERDEGNNFNSLNWVAETFYGLGSGMDTGGKDLSNEAKKYYTNAAKTYAKILKQIAADPSFAPTDADISIKVRLAASLRELGQCEAAMKILVDILEKREKRLDVQIEAARTYQSWGEEKPGYYEYAIKGGHQVGNRYLVWGWGGIAAKVAPLIDKYENTFHEARYNLAVCRMKLALTQSSGEKLETLKQAELDIIRVHQLYPSLGGPEWFAKYDALLKTIQKLRGQQPTGLKGENKSK